MLFDEEDQATIKLFDLHASEFVRTRDRSNSSRTVLFPHQLLSIFGLSGSTPESITLGGFNHNDASKPVRTNEIQFLLRWLTRNGINHEFPNPNDCTEIILNNQVTVRLIDRYRISVADLYELVLNPGDLIINMYFSNYGNYTSQSEQFAKDIGCQVFTKQEFYTYAHRYIK